LSILYRGADDHYDRLPALAAELVSRSVAVIATAGGPVAALAAKSATTTIPIVFAAVSDPVKSGLVSSLNRPGGNVTGNAGLTIELDAERLELLSEIAPTVAVIGALVNANRRAVKLAPVRSDTVGEFSRPARRHSSTSYSNATPSGSFALNRRSAASVSAKALM
jgi:ABC-type uncharacterized transport system substrate-binding protein